ncbi:unnamed protein product [Toxocara canis]|uniref:Uncharacterized protein n=1 Tax=Toxocara canis TaxID=6265 RepID=A0A183UQ57_TOXCA|nr:unnamed protein product [Toxocara canis]
MSAGSGHALARSLIQGNEAGMCKKYGNLPGSTSTAMKRYRESITHSAVNRNATAARANPLAGTVRRNIDLYEQSEIRRAFGKRKAMTLFLQWSTILIERWLRVSVYESENAVDGP